MPLYGSRLRARNKAIGDGIPTLIGTGIFTNTAPNGAIVGHFGRQTPFMNYATPLYPLEMEYTTDDKHPGPPYHSGGPFSNIKVYNPSHKVIGRVHCKGSPNQFGEVLSYDGGFTPIIVSGFLSGIIPSVATNPSFNPLTLLTDNSALSPTVYDRLRPRLEVAGLGVALAEARDMPRMLKTTAGGFDSIWRGLHGNVRKSKMHPKGAANHFLNTQFGWIPFVKDVHQMFDVAYNSRRYMDKIRARNGKYSTRRRTFQDNTIYDVTEKVSSYAVEPLLPSNFFTARPLPPPLMGDGYYYYEIRTQVKKRTWAEGQFTYYRPEFDGSGINSYDSSANEMKRLMTLYGLRITPSVVYRATPWTWLIDWFSNVGDVVQRATDWGVDSIVSKYMYLMTHYIIDVTFKQVLNLNEGPHTFEWHQRLETKQRDEAPTPWGFDLSIPDLSDRRLAILAALGVSRRWII